MTKARTKVLNGTALLIKRRKPMRANNVDKPLESAPTVDEALKVAKKEKDPMNHIDLELMNRLEQAFKEAKENGFKGSYSDFLDTKSKEELKEIGKFSDGGSVDFTGLTPSQLKAIFVSENGYEPRSPKELVRGVKMYLKNSDIVGIPLGAFGEKK
jgi:hypothetical protein